MPPRKRAKLSQAVSPAPASPPITTTPIPAQAASPPNSQEQLPNDAWTDEEEMALFKGLIRFKPTGIHKHFRLLALRQFMLSSGYINPDNPHTKPRGIWEKLHTLYDLEALDAREDARQLGNFRIDDADGDDDESDDAYSEAENKIHPQDFDIPHHDPVIKQLKSQQRRRASASRSPAELPELNKAEQPPVSLTPSFSAEPPGEVATPTARGVGARAGTARGRARGAAAAASLRRSARQAEIVQEGEGGSQAEAEDEGKEKSAKNEEEEKAGNEASAAATSTRTGRGQGRGARKRQ